MRLLVGHPRLARGPGFKQVNTGKCQSLAAGVGGGKPEHPLDLVPIAQSHLDQLPRPSPVDGTVQRALGTGCPDKLVVKVPEQMHGGPRWKHRIAWQQYLSDPT